MGDGSLGGSLHFIISDHSFPIRSFLYGSAKTVHDLEYRDSASFPHRTMNFFTVSMEERSDYLSAIQLTRIDEPCANLRRIALGNNPHLTSSGMDIPDYVIESIAQKPSARNTSVLRQRRRQEDV